MLLLLLFFEIIMEVVVNSAKDVTCAVILHNLFYSFQIINVGYPMTRITMYLGSIATFQ